MSDTTKAPTPAELERDGTNVRKLIGPEPNPHTAAADEYNRTPAQRADAKAPTHDTRGQRIPPPSGPQRIGDLARQLTGVDTEISKLAAIVGLINSMSDAERERTMAYLVDRYPSLYTETLTAFGGAEVHK